MNYCKQHQGENRELQLLLAFCQSLRRLSRTIWNIYLSSDWVPRTQKSPQSGRFYSCRHCTLFVVEWLTTIRKPALPLSSCVMMMFQKLGTLFLFLMVWKFSMEHRYAGTQNTTTLISTTIFAIVINLPWSLGSVRKYMNVLLGQHFDENQYIEVWQTANDAYQKTLVSSVWLLKVSNWQMVPLPRLLSRARWKAESISTL